MTPNIKTSLNGNKLVIEIDVSQSFGNSSTGKSVIVASSQGNVQIEPGLFLGINLYRIANR